MKYADLGVCGQMPKSASKSNRNLRLKPRNQSIALNLTYFNMGIEGINVRIVGGSEVKQPIPWLNISPDFFSQLKIDLHISVSVFVL